MARYAARTSTEQGLSYVAGPSNRAGRYRFDPPEPEPGHNLDKLSRNPFVWGVDVIITIIVLIGLFWFYGSYWTNIASNRAQAEVTGQMQEVWSQDVDVSATPGIVDSSVGDAWLAQMVGSAGEGTPLMKMFIPRLGDDWQYTVVNGVSNESLRTGPGLYTSTQIPGQHGNVGIAGHRDGNGAPFIELEKMEVCDPIVIQTRDNFFIYRVLPAASGEDAGARAEREAQASECLDDHSASIVAGTSGGIGGTDGYDYSAVAGLHVTTPDDNSVIAPMPQDTSVSPEGAGLSVLTITTCHPLYFNYERLITHAVLERVDAVEEGYVPAEIAETAAGQSVWSNEESEA